MTDIDWSKAPEGATHYIPGTAYFHACWGRKNDSMEWETWVIASGTRWVERKNIEFFAIAKPWIGEDLPPVGTVCEWHGPNSDGPNGWEWTEAEVVGLTKDGLFIFMQAASCWPVVQRIDNCEFRPIRAPEQIAEEERKAAIAEMGDLYLSGGLAAIYEAGFRKQEAV